MTLFIVSVASKCSLYRLNAITVVFLMIFRIGGRMSSSCSEDVSNVLSLSMPIMRSVSSAQFIIADPLIRRSEPFVKEIFKAVNVERKM